MADLGRAPFHLKRIEYRKFHPFPLILLFKTGAHLKVTTLLDPNIMPTPVAGFRPLRSCFSFTQNFPKPDINTSSPFSRVFLMISKRDSTRSTDILLGKSR